METVSELPTFEPDVGIFADVAGVIDPASPDVATRGRDSQGTTTGALDEIVTDLDPTAADA